MGAVPPMRTARSSAHTRRAKPTVGGGLSAGAAARTASTNLVAACCLLCFLSGRAVVVSSFVLPTPRLSSNPNPRAARGGWRPRPADDAFRVWTHADDAAPAAARRDDDDEDSKLCRQPNQGAADGTGRKHAASGPDRRTFLTSSAAAALLAAATAATGQPASAALSMPGYKRLPPPTEPLYVLPPRQNADAPSIRGSAVGDALTYPSLSAESCLLKLLPVRNPIFRGLQRNIESVSTLRQNIMAEDKVWKQQTKTIQGAVKTLDSSRNRLQPVFNQDDPTELQIYKAERGERIVGTLRDELLALEDATVNRNATLLFDSQKRALLALAKVGELLVESFPYEVPSGGKFANLPRLVGRSRVTFTMKRGDATLGNVTIIADGFAAPLTAGNFVDLSVRGFYTGLPIKDFTKRLGVDAYESPIDEGIVGKAVMNFPRFGNALQAVRDAVVVEEEEDEDVIATTVPIWGSFQEGFFDPLTGKPRRIPLEVVEIDDTTNTAELAYAGGFSALPPDASEQDNRPAGRRGGGVKGGGGGGGGSGRTFSPILSFDIPGLVALNHPDRYLNGGSSEFFCLPRRDVSPDKTRLLDGQYAPFGYVVDGLDLMQDLRAGDVIAATDVSEFGRLNLVKVRGTSFGDIMQSNSEEED